MGLGGSPTGEEAFPGEAFPGSGDITGLAGRGMGDTGPTIAHRTGPVSVGDFPREYSPHGPTGPIPITTRMIPIITLLTLPTPTPLTAPMFRREW